MATLNLEAQRYQLAQKPAEGDNFSVLSVNVNSWLKGREEKVLDMFGGANGGLRMSPFLLRDIKKSNIIGLADTRLKTEDEEALSDCFPEHYMALCLNNFTSKREFEGTATLISKKIAKSIIAKGSFQIDRFSPHTMSYILFRSINDSSIAFKPFIAIHGQFAQLLHVAPSPAVGAAKNSFSGQSCCIL